MEPQAHTENPHIVDPLTGILDPQVHTVDPNLPSALDSAPQPPASDSQPLNSDLQPEAQQESTSEGPVTSGDLEQSLSKVSPFKRPRSESQDHDSRISEEPSVQVRMYTL